MHRTTIIFLLSQKITTVQSKTAEINNHINQPQNQSGTTITTNNHSTKYYQKHNPINQPRKQPRQSIPAFAKQKHAQNKPQQTNTTNYLTNRKINHKNSHNK